LPRTIQSSCAGAGAQGVATMASEVRPLAARLVELRHAVGDSDRRVTEAEAELARSRRSVDRATGPLREYYERVGAGEIEPDGERERDLRAAVAAAQATVSLRPVMVSGETRWDAVDERAEALLAGARRGAEAARAAVRDFAAEHFERLAAERLPRSRAVGASYTGALVAMVRADAEHTGEVRWWLELHREAFGDRHPLTDEPVSPGLVAAPLTLPPRLALALQEGRVPRGVVPAPRWLLDDDEEGDDRDA
jgi:hypothetical protein